MLEPDRRRARVGHIPSHGLSGLANFVRKRQSGERRCFGLHCDRAPLELKSGISSLSRTSFGAASYACDTLVMVKADAERAVIRARNSLLSCLRASPEAPGYFA